MSTGSDTATCGPAPFTETASEARLHSPSESRFGKPVTVNGDFRSGIMSTHAASSVEAASTLAGGVGFLNAMNAPTATMASEPSRPIIMPMLDFFGSGGGVW